jgi:hypothetical protein
MISSDVVDVVLRAVMLGLKFMYTICSIPNAGSLKQVMVITDFCIR